jgi:hypothetical protein
MSREESPMQFRLIGFSQVAAVRVFSFRAVGDDKTESIVKISADVNRARTLGISIQQLPLLCARMLSRREGEPASFAALSVDQMREYAGEIAASTQTALEKKAARSRQAVVAAASWRARAAGTKETGL